MSLGVLDTPVKWRETPQDEIGDVHQRMATFDVPTKHGDVGFFVSGARFRSRKLGHEVFDISFDMARSYANDRVRRMRQQWHRYQMRNPRRRSMRLYLERSNRHDDLAYYTRFLKSRGAAPAKSFTIIATVADIVQQWLLEGGYRYVSYAPSDETRARLYRTMVRMLAPKAVLVSTPEDPTDMHVWKLRP